QLLQERLDFLRPDRELFDERDGLAAANLDAPPQPATLFLTHALVEAAVEFLDVEREQMLQRLEVVRHALEDLVLLEVLGERDLDRAVEGQIAGVNTLERIDHLAQGVVAFEDFAAETLAGDFDLLGESDFLVALE